MSKFFKLVPALASVLALSGTAFALNNDLRTVSKVEVTSGNLLVVWTDALASKPAGCATYDAVVCTLSSDWCKQAQSVASMAALTGRKVDIEVSSTCNGTWAQFSRLRMR